MCVREYVQHHMSGRRKVERLEFVLATSPPKTNYNGSKATLSTSYALSKELRALRSGLPRLGQPLR